MGAFAEDGYDGVRVQQLADDIGITRNLINHYFPGGKHELYLEAVQLACDEILEMLDTDPTLDIETKMPANIAGYVDEALVPTPRYTLFMRSLHSADPEVAAIALEARERYVTGAMINNFGNPEGFPEARAAMAGAIGYMEAIAAEWRRLGIKDRDRLMRILVQMTAGSMEAARDA